MKNLIDLIDSDNSFSFFNFNDFLFSFEKLTTQCQRRYYKASYFYPPKADSMRPLGILMEM